MILLLQEIITQLNMKISKTTTLHYFIFEDNNSELDITTYINITQETNILV